MRPKWWQRLTRVTAREAKASKPPILHDHFDAAASWAAQAGSAFFTVLPPEVRRKILIAAFGGRTLHIVHWKNFKTKKDHWLGCTCRDEGEDLSRDHCVGRERLTDEMQIIPRGEEDLSVGAMGWLRSCSLAFAEGIEVLYATNTLDVRSETLRMSIDNYLPMQHAPLVTSLQWSLDPGFMARWPGDLRGADQLQQLARLLRALPAALPGLRRLFFGVDHRSSFWEECPLHFKRCYQLFTRDVLPLLDGAARALGGGCGGGLAEMEAAVPWIVFWPHFHVGMRKGLRFQAPLVERRGSTGQGSFHPRWRVWRPVAPLPAEEGAWAGQGEAPPDPAGPGHDAEKQLQRKQLQQHGYWLSGNREFEDFPSAFAVYGPYAHLQPEVMSSVGVAGFEQAWNSPCDEPAMGPLVGCFGTGYVSS